MLDLADFPIPATSIMFVVTARRDTGGLNALGISLTGTQKQNAQPTGTQKRNPQGPNTTQAVNSLATRLDM